MSYILCIETATTVCSVALVKHKEVVSLHELVQPNMHASHLHLCIQECLQEAQIDFYDLEAIAVSMGPGSYTGLRVGVAAAKGLCYALNIPLLAIDTLKAMAWGYIKKYELNKNQLVVPMIDARRMEVYTSVFNNVLDKLMLANAMVVEPNSFEPFKHAELIFIGNGALKCSEVLSGYKAKFLNFKTSAAYMASLAQNDFDQKVVKDLAYFEPFYLKDFVGTKPKLKL